jgi:RNA recognition motif.
MAIFTKIDPAHMAETETANLVHVFNISPDSSEKKIVDFFQYCGDIIEYEIVQVENGFEALLLFDKASSVDTAVLLNNSRIDDRNIIVKKYDDAVREAAAAAADAPVTSAQPTTGSSKLANFIADTMIKAEALGKSVDSKLGVTEKFQLLVEESKKLKDTVDAKYGISEKTAKATTAINTKIDEFKHSEKVTAARTAAQPRVAAARNAAQPTIENIKHSATVKKIQDAYAQVKEKVNEVTQETMKIKKAKTLNLTPEESAAMAEAEATDPKGAAVAAESKESNENSSNQN